MIYDGTRGLLRFTRALASLGLLLSAAALIAGLPAQAADVDFNVAPDCKMTLVRDTPNRSGNYRWTGPCEQGRAHGQGSLFVWNVVLNGWLELRGEMRNGRKDGPWLEPSVAGDPPAMRMYYRREYSNGQPPETFRAISPPAWAGVDSSNPPGTAHAQAVGQSQNQAANSGRCKPNLKHVGTWADAGVRAPEVQQMMDAVQAQDVREAMRKARLQGFSTEAMIKATEDQALQFDRVARESSQCAAETDAFGATDAQFLKQAPLVLPASCSGIRNACVCSVAVNRLSAIAARELAKQMRCFASVDIGGNGSPTNAGQADVPTNQNRSNASAGSPTCPAGLVRLPWGCRDPNEDPFGGSKR